MYATELRCLVIKFLNLKERQRLQNNLYKNGTEKFGVRIMERERERWRKRERDRAEKTERRNGQVSKKKTKDQAICATIGKVEKAICATIGRKENNFERKNCKIKKK